MNADMDLEMDVDGDCDGGFDRDPSQSHPRPCARRRRRPTPLLVLLLLLVLTAFTGSVAWRVCRHACTTTNANARLGERAAIDHRDSLMALEGALANEHVLPKRRDPPTQPIGTCDVMCRGPLLHAIQSSSIFNDSKTFVDLTLRYDPAHVYANFLRLSPDQATNSTILRQFLEDNFLPLNTDLLPWLPPDFRLNASFLRTLRDPTVHSFGATLHTLWTALTRQVAPSVYEHTERHTMLDLEQPYLIVPGGRFREFYYWDSYWVVRGLLVSDMLHTAQLVVDNLLAMVRRYGFVPNGSRKYYVTRSQPPMLTPMTRVLYEHLREHARSEDAPAMTTARVDQWLLVDALPQLDREYAFWMAPGVHAVAVGEHILNRYVSEVSEPRPESYKEDVLTACELLHGSGDDCARSNNALLREASVDERVRRLYRELRASAESGWDFSSRWLRDSCNLSTSYTSDLLPVDLNAILYKVEIDLAALHEQAFRLTRDRAHRDASDTYREASERRLDAMHALLWSVDDAQWVDYDWMRQRPAQRLRGSARGGATSRAAIALEHLRRSPPRDVPYASNFVPLWSGAYRPRDVNVSRVINALLRSSGLLGSVGVVTSLQNSGQQWDYPSAWPPVQHMLIEGIRNVGAAYVPDDLVASLLLDREVSNGNGGGGDDDMTAADRLAFGLSSAWLLNCYRAYQEYGVMWEKYSAVQPATPVSRGEYVVQAGFGWTNGVALILMHQFSARWNFSTMVERAQAIASFSANFSHIVDSQQPQTCSM